MCVGFSLCFPFSLPCRENGGQKCAVVAWNQLQFTSVTSERIEDEFRVPKVVRDVENGEDSAVIGYEPIRWSLGYQLQFTSVSVESQKSSGTLRTERIRQWSCAHYGLWINPCWFDSLRAIIVFFQSRAKNHNLQNKCYEKRKAIWGYWKKSWENW